MKRKTRGGHHRAQSPARASNTAIAAALILTIVLLAALVIWAICASHKLGGDTGNYNKSLRKAPVESAPLIKPTVTTLQGDDGVDTPRESVVTLPLDEPLEGGGATGAARVDPGVSETPTSVSSVAPQQRSIWTTNAAAYIHQIIAQQKAARERCIAVWRIDTYLAHKGSPMQGCGEFYIQNQERTGIPGSLSAGIAEAESTNGMRTYNSHTDACPGESYNAWGMINSRFYGGFGSWENGIRANFDWLMEWHSHGGTQPPQTIHDCSGYCVGNTTSQTVDDVQWQINAYEPPEGI